MHPSRPWAFVASVLLAGCATPTASTGATLLPPESASSTVAPSISPSIGPATANPVPDSSPTPPAGVSVRWSPGGIEGPATFEDMVRGAGRWVGVSACSGGQCTSAHGAPVWTSADAARWVENDIASGEGETSAPFLAVGSSGFVVATEKVTDGPVPPNELWGSADGRDWTLIGQVPEVRCEKRSCPRQQSLALAPSGTIVVSFEDQRDEASLGPYVSDDGVRWRLVDPSAFGLDRLFVDSIQSSKSDVLLMGRSCWDCRPGLWTSTDGATWQPVNDMRVGAFSQPRLATGGRTRVIVEGSGGTEIWASTDRGPWSLVYSDPDVFDPEVAYSGSAFVAVGVDADRTFWVVLGSADGTTWDWVVNDSAMNPADEDCPPGWLAGGAGTVLVGGQDGCAPAWQGAVTVN